MLLDPVRLSRLAAGGARSAVVRGKVPGPAAWGRWVLAHGIDDTLHRICFAHLKAYEQRRAAGRL